MTRKRWLFAVPLLVLLAWVSVRTAWMADDAYITFRVSDNWISGFGPRWNTYERVQAFTNPLWMIVATIVLLFTREAFVSLSIVQILLTVLAGIVLVKNARTTGGGALALLVLCLSRAFVDFSASGMENALAHALAIAWAGGALRSRAPRTKEVLLAALLLVTRLDFLWLVLPRLLMRRPRWRALVLGASPFLAWEGFAFLYYGSFIPNSARAKLSSGIAESRLIESGLSYFAHSLRIDPLTLGAIFVAMAIGLASHRRAVALGLGATLAYILFIGGDFMSGRFFTVPLAVAATIVADLRVMPRGFASGASAAGLLAAKVGAPTITDRYQTVPDIDAPIIDCRLAFHPFSGLTVPRAQGPGLIPTFVEFGRSLRDRKEPVVLPAIGIAGYYGGPGVRIIDAFALSDPLRSRLPIPDAKNESFLKMGHFMRPVPEGYLETVASGENVIRHPALHAYYDAIALVTRGPIFSPKRIWTALLLELGQLGDLRADYLSTYGEKPVQLFWLPPHGAPPSALPGLPCYTWWRACAPRGYAFTETGLRVILDGSHAERVAIEATPGPYDVIFRQGDREIARQTIDVGGQGTFVVPAPARQAGFDVIAFYPRSQGRTVMESLVLLPP